MFSKRSLTTFLLGASLGVGSAGFLGSHFASALAADAKKDADEHKDWLKADYARDAREHVLKAHEEMVIIEKKGEKDDPKDIENAKKSLDDSLGYVNDYLAHVAPDEKKK